MADQPARLEAATVRAEVGSNIVYRFANDAASEPDIPTLSGEIPNLSKIILTIQQEGADKISFSTRIYQTTAAGIAATSDKEIFLVQTDDPDEIYAVWQNVAGTAVDTGKRSLSAAAVIAATQAASDAATAAQESADEATDRVARFLAPSSVEPVQRDNGQPLEVGDQWPNSSDGLVYNWNGSAWVALNGDVQDLENRLSSDSGSSLIPSATGNSQNLAEAISRANNNKTIITQSPRGNDKCFALYAATGVVSPAKAGTSEPPYIYDRDGNEYMDKRPVSFQYIPQMQPDISPKMVVSSPFVAGQIFVMLRKKSKGYVVVGLSNNVTVNTPDSLGQSGSDPTMRRVVSVLSAVSVVAGRMGSPVESGAWANPELGSILPEIPGFSSSRGYKYKQTNSVGAKLAYSAMTPLNGSINLSFVCSASGNPAAEISIDGVISKISLVSSTAKIRQFRFPTNSEACSVEITNASPGAVYFVNYLGQDFSTLDKWSGAAVDTWGYYRNSAEADYIISNSENDYTMMEYYTKIYGGGYHGGETGIIDAFIVDGAQHTPTDVPKIGTSLAVESSCSISWASVWKPEYGPVAPSVSVRKSYEFAEGGYAVAVTINGGIVLRQLYAALFGASLTFSEIESPYPSSITATTPNNGRKLLGRANEIVMRNPSTGQKIHLTYTVSKDDTANQYGGLYIWRVDGVNGYLKAYSNVAHEGRLPITGNFSRTICKFP